MKFDSFICPESLKNRELLEEPNFGNQYEKPNSLKWAHKLSNLPSN